jgi:hypothetical protein
MSIKEGMSRAAPIIDSFFEQGVLNQKVYGPFDAAVMKYADERASTFTAPAECETGYDSHRPELQMWFFGIMLSEYVAGLLASKIEEGHCNKHRKEPMLTPCPKTRGTHLEMLRSFRADLAALVSEVEEKIKDLSRFPQS